jgi:hypothetical protein
MRRGPAVIFAFWMNFATFMADAWSHPGSLDSEGCHHDVRDGGKRHCHGASGLDPGADTKAKQRLSSSDKPKVEVDRNVSGAAPSQDAAAARDAAQSNLVRIFVSLLAVLVVAYLVRKIRQNRKSGLASTEDKIRKMQIEDAASVENERESQISNQVSALLAEFERDPVAILDEIRSSYVPGTQAENVYRVKPGEVLLLVVPASLARISRKSRTATVAGLTASVKVLGPIRFRAGQIALQRLTEDVLQEEGQGYMVVTNQRLMFNASGYGKNWMRTWSSIPSWSLYRQAIQIEQPNSSPLFLVFQVSTPQTHPAFLGRVLEYAHDSI